MTIQPFRVNLSIASPAEIERTARQLSTVREGFLSTGSLALWTPRPLILDSWQRCRVLDVNPSRRFAPLAVARETQLYQLREKNALLIQAARPVMNHLIDFLADSGYVVVLSDAQGRLLDVAGDAAIRRRLARIDFVPGGNWSEAAAGTNAIGTALADEHVVQLMAAEHYCDGWQDLTCTASPIRHPLTHEIIGVLDVTGDYHLIRPFLTSFLAAAALEIRQLLHGLLTSLHTDEWQKRHYKLVKSLPGHVQAIEINMSETHPPKSDQMPSPVSIDDMQWQLDLQERRAHDAERLAAASGAISASLDLNVTLEKVVEQVAHLLRVEQAGVNLFNEQDEITSMHVLSTQMAAPMEQPRTLAALLKNARAVSLIRERGEPVVTDDVRASTLLPATFIEQTGIRSIVLLPLVTARGVSGFITAARPALHNWAVDDIRLGLAFATQSATAIENARLFETLQQHNRHIETLNTIAQLLSNLPDPGQHLDLVLQRITNIINLDAGMILRIDQSGRLTLAAYCRLAENLQLDLDTQPLKTFQMLARRVIDTQEPLLICASDSDEPAIGYALHRLGFHNLIAVPLAASSMVLGVLLVGSSGHDSCCMREDLTFFSTIGQQLGLALRNAELLRSASEMEALREADRLKSGFLAAVSHDLHSPLTAIRASVESLLDADGVQSATGKDHLLHNIAGQANRLGQLVDQLLDLSKIEAGVLALDCDWMELPVLIEDAIAEFARLHSACCIERNIEPDLPLHYIDPDRLVQVLWNLLENAYKYAPQGASILVEARWVDKEVLIRVADRGPGIPRREHEKIFQRFYRLDRDQRSHTKGSGLGLAICKGIVEAHRGRIWVEDREGGGSVFVIALSLSASDPIGFDVSPEQELMV